MPTRTAIDAFSTFCMERLASGVAGRGAKLLFDAQELVVFVYTLTTRGCARLDLTGVGADGQISNSRVFGFPGPMRDDGREAGRTCHVHRLERFGDGADLVDLDQDGVAGTFETLEAVHMARSAGFAAVISHRSGETEDTTIA